MSYTSDSGAGYRQSHRGQEDEASAFSDGATEDGSRPESPMGKGEGGEGVPPKRTMSQGARNRIAAAQRARWARARAQQKKTA